MKRIRKGFCLEAMDKGTSFELDMVKLVRKEPEEGNLGLSPMFSRVILNPKYYSRDRNKDIVFDVSIEVFRRSAEKPYLIWTWECKNYTDSVPVDDVEELHAKHQQIGQDKTKGTMITSAAFARGAIDFARSKGIGLCRWIAPESLKYFIENTLEPASSDIMLALTTPETFKFRSFGDFYDLTCRGCFTTSKQELIERELTQWKLG